MSTASKRFVILATPRSGSNWLCTLLDSHPDILCHHELFNPDGVHIAWSQRRQQVLSALTQPHSAPLELLARTWSQSLSHTAVGFKLNIGQDEAVFEAVLSDPSISKILLWRSNRVRAYVSEQLAERSGQWESYPDSEQPVHCEPVHIDPAALLAHAQRNQVYREDIRRRLLRHQQQALETSYEAIGERTTQRRLLTFIGVDPARTLQGQTRKMNRTPLERLIANFDALQTALADTELAKDLIQEEPYD